MKRKPINFSERIKNMFQLNKGNGTVNQQDKKRVSHKITRGYQYRIGLDLSSFRAAIDSAKLPDMPQREMLYIIYSLISKDSHLASQTRTAKQTVQQSGFYITDRSGKESKVLTELLQQQWFDTFISLSLEAEFWGHSLIEFGQLDTAGHFDELNLIPRPNVLPELGMVVLNIGDQKGIAYRKAITQLALIEVGDRYNLGLFELAAPDVIVKNYSRTDWGQASERYGMPLLKVNTDTQDEKELDRMELSARNFGSAGYIILGQDDDAEIIADAKTDRYKIYLANIDLCNASLSKLINGQTMTSDNGKGYSQAKVHERILNNYTIARLRRMQNIVNSKLIPFLISWGYPLEGARFQYVDLLKEKEDIESSIDHQSLSRIERVNLNAPDATKNPTIIKPDSPDKPTQFILSDESINSHGFWVKTDGIDLSRFKINPVMLYNHDHEQYPIGQWLNTAMVGSELISDAEFDTGDPEAIKIKEKVERGFIKGVSVGLEILELSKDKTYWKPGQTRHTIVKSVLVEASITPVPSNKNALKLFLSDGTILNVTDKLCDGELCKVIPKL